MKKRKIQDSSLFHTGCWITAWARSNLIRCLIQLDQKEIYADTDSLKVFGDYDKSVIDNYNKSVEERIKRVSKELDIPIEKFAPKDNEGIPHMLRTF